MNAPTWLQGLESDWSNNPPAAPAPAKPMVKDGYHDCLIVSMKMDPVKPLIRTKLRFLDLDNLERDKIDFVSGRLDWLRSQLSRINADIENIKDLPAVLENQVGKIVTIFIKSKEGEKYQRMYFSKDTGNRIEIPINEFDSAQTWVENSGVADDWEA